MLHEPPSCVSGCVCVQTFNERWAHWKAMHGTREVAADPADALVGHPLNCLIAGKLKNRL